jgi:thiol:disulfide interchange protein DsbC
MKRLLQVLLVLALPGALIGYQVLAQSGDREYRELRQNLDQSLGVATQGQLSVRSVQETPVANLVEVTLSSGEVLFSDSTGRYLFTGDMLRTSEQGFVNVSADNRRRQNAELVAQLPSDQLITFAPDNVLATITVFTDVDCTYCRRMHHDIEEINARGIEVRYAAFPRGGPQSGAWDKMISVWCSDDQQQAITQAKNGQNLPERDCVHPIMEQYELGNRVGITGTPAMVLENGTVVPGYMDVDRLAGMVLNQ